MRAHGHRVTQLLTNTSSDAQTRAIAVAALAGEVPEAAARQQIAWLIQATGVPQEVADSERDLEDRVRQDLAMKLSDLLYAKCVGIGKISAELDFQRLADGASAAGWARMLLKKAASSEMRPIWRHENSHFLANPNTPDTENDLTGADFGYLNASVDSADSISEENMFVDIHINYAELSKGRGHIAKTRQGAYALRQMYDITAPIIIPANPTDRAWVEQQLEADESLAYTSVIQWLSILGHGKHPAEWLDARILDLWNEFDLEQMLELSKMRPASAHILALATAMLYPRPSRDVIPQVVRAVQMAASDDRWEQHASALVESWIAKNCVVESEFKTKSNADEHDMLVRHELAAGAWPELVKKTVAWHGTPFGTSEETIHKMIARAFTAVDPKNFPPAV